MLYTIKLLFLTTMYLYSSAYKFCSGLLNADTATSPQYCAHSRTREKMRLIVRLFEVYV